MRRSIHLISGLAGLAALAGALLVPIAADASPASSQRHATSAAHRIDYVAMGDSYSAGPLVPSPRGSIRFDPYGPGGCARSWNNYPAFLAGYLKVRTYTDVTCSGAQTKDFAEAQGLSFLGATSYAAPQLDALSKGTDLVTIGIGGNDYGLFGSLVDTCGELAAANPDAATPCRDSFTVDGVDTRAEYARAIQARITAVVKAVQKRAPHAKVYVVGYPRLLPDSGTCDAVGFAPGDVPWGDEIQHLLNQSLRHGAKARGAHFVSMEKASAGHDACAGDDAWINGSTTVLSGPDAAASFHPFLAGERGMARQAYRVITRSTSAPTSTNAKLGAVGTIEQNPTYTPPAS